MNNLRRSTTYFITLTLLLTTNLVLGTSVHMDESTYIKAMTEQYLSSFLQEKTKKTVIDREKELSKKIYELADRPSLTMKERSAVLCKTCNNDAFKTYYNTDKKVIFDHQAWYASNILQGTTKALGHSLINQIARPGAGAIERMGLVYASTMPTYDIKELERRQTAGKRLLTHEQLYEKLKHEFDTLRDIESSLLSFYTASEPTEAAAYKRMLQQRFQHKKGDFVNRTYIEFDKRFFCDFTLFISITGLFIGISIRARTIIVKQNLPWSKFFSAFFIVCKAIFKEHITDRLVGASLLVMGLVCIDLIFKMYLFCISIMYTYKVYKGINDYISLRLSDASKVLHIAQNIYDLIQNDPVLKEILAPQMKYTSKLLEGKHDNDNYNKLAYRLRHNDFTNWSLWFNSAGTLMTTLTLLKNNRNMYNSIFFECGQVSLALTAAHLLKNEQGHSNTYVYPELLLNKKYPVINIKQAWNPFIPAHRAVANDLIMNGSHIKVRGIVGGNGSGKSQVAITHNIIATMTHMGLPVPAQKAQITPFGGIGVGKGPEESVATDESLFMQASAMTKNYLNEQRYCAQHGLFYLGIFDELLSGTNYTENGALMISLLNYILKNFDNSLTIVVCHHNKVAEALHQGQYSDVKKTQTKVQGDKITPLYTLTDGHTYLKTGIRVFKAVTGEKEIAEEAQRLIDDDKASTKA